MDVPEVWASLHDQKHVALLLDLSARGPFRWSRCAGLSDLDRFLEVIESFGTVEVIPHNTRIATQAEVRFASCTTRKKRLVANLWLTRSATHPRLQRVEELGLKTCSHQFRLDSPTDLDPAFCTLIGESHDVGIRKHLAP